ncbi:MAG: response regulator, partial [Candidatus Tectomicrobia bacterium]|nr:response regulator [Candidatus Tectomicrobia bacterium]
MANQLLLVDDSPLIHRVVELTFEGYDFSIRAADTPEQALALARSLKPDINVARAEMKGAGGAEISRRLRQEEELGEVPVLL